MSPNRLPRKPDRYKRGDVYLCHLPKQIVTETTDGIVHYRDGAERHGSPTCVVISTECFNDNQANGVRRTDHKRHQRRLGEVQSSAADMGSNYYSGRIWICPG
jgi:hypothetical protein